MLGVVLFWIWWTGGVFLVFGFGVVGLGIVEVVLRRGCRVVGFGWES